MNSLQSKHRFLFLWIALFLQMIHTLLEFDWLISTQLISPTTYGRTIGTEYVQFIPPLSERLHLDFLFFMCTAAVFELMIWRWLSQKNRAAWNYLAIMISALVLNLLYATALRVMPYQTGYLWDGISFIAAILGFVGLWLSQGEFAVGRKDLLQIAASIILALIVVYLNARYFPHGAVPNHPVGVVPAYVDIVAVSRFTFQESVLVLCLGCYLFVRLCSSFCRLKRDGAQQLSGRLEKN